MNSEDKKFTYKTYKFRLGRRRVRVHHFILLALLYGPAPSYLILVKLQSAGYEFDHTRQISSRLVMLKNRGLVVLDGSFWRLTEMGERVAKQLLQAYKEIARDDDELRQNLELVLEAIDRTRKTGDHGLTRDDFLELVRSVEEDFKREVVEEIRHRHRVKEDKIEVVEAVLDHWLRHGVTYLYADQLRDDYGFDANYLRKALRHLQAKAIVYLYRTSEGYKVGIGRNTRKIIVELYNKYKRKLLLLPANLRGVMNNTMCRCPDAPRERGRG